jgi:hypothetical protein
MRKEYPNYHLMKYHSDEEYRKLAIQRAVINDRNDEAKRRYNHYKRLIEDIEYFNECKTKGLRLRKVPEEFVEILKQMTKK